MASHTEMCTEEDEYSLDDIYDDEGKPSGTAVSLMIPLDFKSREK